MSVHCTMDTLLDHINSLTACQSNVTELKGLNYSLPKKQLREKLCNKTVLGALARAHPRIMDDPNVTASSWALSQKITYNMPSKDLPGKLKEGVNITENAPPASIF